MKFLTAVFVSIPFIATYIHASDDKLEELVVNADFHKKTLDRVSSSVSVVNSDQLAMHKAVHLEDILNSVPNVNFSSGASRGRFIQIRGTGERAQYSEPINFSVGLIVDDIDFTGIGGALSTLDVKQIEVLRGPQGTLYGANALAGLINVVSEDGDNHSGKIRINLAEYNIREFSQAVGGAINDELGVRVAFANNQSDGFIKNTYLNRDDTNNIDETSLRTKFLWQPDSETTIRLTAYLFDADNGYDAFSLDNTRETLSDEPGHDRNRTRASSLRINYSGFDLAQWQTVVSVANSDLEYGFDEDWSYRTICANDFECAGRQYSTKDNMQRDNNNYTIDTRWISNSVAGELSWVMGLYARSQTEDLLRTYTNNDPNSDTFDGEPVDREITLFSHSYDTENIAVYANVEIPLFNEFYLNTGLRVEQRDAAYKNSRAETIENDEAMWGGKLALEYRAWQNHFAYGLISRGYKAGGNNIPGPQDDEGNGLFPLLYDTEAMWNYEIGLKSKLFNDKVSSNLSVFYQDRKDMQLKQSVVVNADSGEISEVCPCRFLDHLANAGGGINYGLEYEVNAQFTERFAMWLNLGVLETQYIDYQSYSHANADPQLGNAYDLSGRAQAHAPLYQYAIGLAAQLSENLYWDANVESKADFYTSANHDEKAQGFILLHSRLVLSLEEWELSLWGKNLTDKDTVVRGFGGFGNDPRKLYEVEPYVQYGAPRVLGVSAALQFN